MNSSEVELSIQDFSSRGFGVASCKERRSKIEVAHTIPGDRVLVELRRRKQRVQKGRLLQLLSPSEDRVEPRCTHASLCGGCSWQQMAYDAQLRHKQQRIFHFFEGLIDSEARLLPMIPCESPWAYRNKMEFSFSENRGGAKYLGLMIAHAEPYVFNLEECRIAPSWMSECLGRVRSWWEASGIQAYYPPKDTGALRYLTLRSSVRTDQKMAVLNVSGNPEFAPPKEELLKFTQAVGDGVGVFIRIHQTKKGVPTRFYEMHLAGLDHIEEELRLKTGPLRFKISPASFFQPNTLQAEKLYDAAMDLIGEGGRLLFDLYCGTGTLGMAAARKAKRVIGIELSPEAILDAEENALKNGLSNISFYQGDAAEITARLLATGHELPECVIVDPPRAGLGEAALQQIKALSPNKILYVSCNPETQAEDVKRLASWGYRLAAMQAVDQFPHTAHIENLALLLRPV